MSKQITALAAATALAGTELVELSQLSPTVTITAATISADGDDNSFNDSADGFVAAGFQVNDRVRVQGFTGDVANNLFVGTITALTASKMTIGGTDGDVIVDDAEGESVTISKWVSARSSLDDLATLFATATPREVVTLLVSDPNGDAITTGNGKVFWPVPSTINGWNLVAVAAFLTTASSSGNPSVQVHNLTQAADMLTTNITIDSGETHSSSAATPAVIDGANDDVATGDMLRIDIDAAGTGAKGLIVELQFEEPA
jgi:hypothetical protein